MSAILDRLSPEDRRRIRRRPHPEIGFTEWTGDGRLRHPRFLGLRDDKRAIDVVPERPA